MDEKGLSAQEREKVIREAFDALAQVGLMKWEAEEIALGYKVDDEGRKEYLAIFEENTFGWFHQLAANAPDERLLDVWEYWIDKADKMGLKDWQEVLSQGKGGQPFYSLVAEEMPEKETREQSMADMQKQASEQAKHQGESMGKGMGT